jgi:hypothetical protein
MFDLKEKHVMTTMSKSPIPHLVGLQTKLKLTKNKKSKYF